MVERGRRPHPGPRPRRRPHPRPGLAVRRSILRAARRSDGPLRTRPQFSSAAHDERTASVLGVALGLAFGTCLLTGIFSHLAQHPPSWFLLPTRPAGLYRVTQGLHVATGIAAIP